ncbi:hypothetical protein [Agaribacterium haliotis]|uniref:hypothetical protein n=1 Tax=Agaribacterium haliotis TaxID=2013869 RepID=UPI000BB55CC1|nr:hypothetical protein [Agaribacterium haliotis]
MKTILFGVVLMAAGLVGCADKDKGQDEAKMVGGDRDEHGCIGSAGFSWCERTGKCERPWELASKVGFENTAEAFDKYCASKEP